MAAGDAKPVPIRATALRITFPILDADGDLVSGATSPDSEFSEDAAAFADCAGEATEIATASGMYYLDLANTETDGDTVSVIIKSGTGKTTPIVMYPQSAANPINVNVQAISTDSTAADNAEAFFDGNGYAGTGNVIPTVTTVTNMVTANATQISGDSAAADNLELFFDGNGYNAANSTVGTVSAVTAVSAGGITATSIAADAIGASELAADAIAEIADAVWDEAMSGHVTLGTYGQAMRAHSISGEVNDAGASTTAFIVDGLTEDTDDHFNGSVIVFTEGANAGQSRVITDYTGATQTVTVAEAFTDTPANNDNFIIIPGSVFIGGTLAQVARLFVTILAADGTLDAGSFTAGAIDANALAASAIDEFWDEAMTESGGVPAVSASFRDAIRWMFALTRNKITQTATTQALRNDADSGNIATAAVSDDGVTATRGEWA